MFEAVKSLLNESSLQYIPCMLFSRLVALTKIPNFAEISQRLQKSSIAAIAKVLFWNPYSVSVPS